MPRDFKNWTNQYISLIETKPDYIIVMPSREEFGETRKKIHDAISSWKGGICVEIGSGSGGHLIELASRNPQNLYFGFELRFKRVFRTAEKAEKLGVKNLRIIQGDATIISSLFDPESLEGIYVNFPDPWSKPKQRKHRLLNEKYLQELFALLRPNGFFAYKTDHHGYFVQTEGFIRGFPGVTIHRSTNDLLRSEYSNENIPTEFEMLFLSQGLTINYLYAVRSQLLS